MGKHKSDKPLLASVKGGLGLKLLFAPDCKPLLFLRDVKDTFIRTACQLRLGKQLPYIVESTNNLSGSIHGFLKEVVQACIVSSAQLSLDYLAAGTRKKNMYKNLCDVVLPVPLYRSMYPVGRGKDVLNRAKKGDRTCRNENILFPTAYRHACRRTLAGRKWHVRAMGNALHNV